MDPIRLVAYKKEDGTAKMVIYMLENGEYDYVFQPSSKEYYDSAKEWAETTMKKFLENIKAMKKLLEADN